MLLVQLPSLACTCIYIHVGHARVKFLIDYRKLLSWHACVITTVKLKYIDPV